MDLDAVMDAVRNKPQRAPFLEKLERELGAVTEEEWSSMIDDPRPDKAWTHLRSALTAATTSSFPAGAPPEEEELVKRRLALLSRRRALKGSIYDEESHA